VSAASSSDADGTIEEYRWDFGDGNSATSSNATTTHVYGSEGEYLVQVTVIDDADNASTATTTVRIAPAPINLAARIVISEVLFDAAGSDEGKEFIELYNAATTTLDLSGWSLRYIAGEATTSVSLAALSSATSSTDTTRIGPFGFLLIGLNSYDATNFSDIAPDVRRTRSLPNGIETAEVLLLNENGDEVDRVAYSSSSIAAEGQSLERKAFIAGECVDPSGDGEHRGNGCDTDALSDWTIRAAPRPQNTENLPEPREAPVLVGVAGTYASSSLKISLAWNDAMDSQGSTSSVSYAVHRFENEADVLELWRGTGTAFSQTVTEVGKHVIFGVRAIDRDGLMSATSTTSISVSSFLDRVLWYRDPSSGGRFVLDLRYAAYPFVPDVYWVSPGDDWKAVVFFLNSSPAPDEFLLIEDLWEPRAGGTLRLEYARCSGSITYGRALVLPDHGGKCGASGGLFARSLVSRSIGGNRIKLSMPEPDGRVLGAEDYITAAFYSFYASGPATRLKIVAVDKTEHYFSETLPTSTPPIMEGDVTTEFSAENGRVIARWQAASDSDSPVDALTYEVNIATSSDAMFTEEGWGSVGGVLSAERNVSPGDELRFGIRARDEFGAVSNIIETLWRHP